MSLLKLGYEKGVTSVLATLYCPFGGHSDEAKNHFISCPVERLRNWGKEWTNSLWKIKSCPQNFEEGWKQINPKLSLKITVALADTFIAAPSETQLSQTWIPNPQKLWDINAVLNH